MSKTSDDRDPLNLPAVPLAPLRSDDPAQLGHFRILGRLGTGGMGIAYLASDPHQNWIVVKRIWPHLAADRVFRSRLNRELGVMRSIVSDSTATLVDASSDEQDPWFAMEFIPGVTLVREVDDAGPLDPEASEQFAKQLLDVLSDVHSAGVTHRDLKPSNIMLSPTGPQLIDFGIAGLEGVTQLTETGSVVGSNGWLAPEQVRGEDATSATDIHAWALCALFAATGRSPFAADNSATAIYRVLEITPDIPELLSPGLKNALHAALAKDPAARPTIAQLKMQLESSPDLTSEGRDSYRGVGVQPPTPESQMSPAPRQFTRSSHDPINPSESPIRWGSFWVTFWISLFAFVLLLWGNTTFFPEDSITQWSLTVTFSPVLVVFLIGFRPTEFARVRRSPLTYSAIAIALFLILSLTLSAWALGAWGPDAAAPALGLLVLVAPTSLLVALWILPAAWVALLAKKNKRNMLPSLILGSLVPGLGPLVGFFLTSPTSRQKRVYWLTLGTIVSFIGTFAVLAATSS